MNTNSMVTAPKPLSKESAGWRLVAVATHPIQYHTPLFTRLAKTPHLDFSVLFAHKPTPREQGDGFGVDFEWDVEFTAGFTHRWLRNRARRPSVTRFWGCNTPEVRHYLTADRVDAVLVMGWNSLCYVQAAIAAWRQGLPVLVRGDSHLGTKRSSLKRSVKAWMYPFWIGRFAVCLAVGERSAEYFRHYGARKVVWSPHCVDNAWFAERASRAVAERAQLRRKWGCSPESFLFLFAGKLEEKKRPIDAIEGLRRCRASGVDAELLVVGDGALREACEKIAGQAQLPVRFAGFVNQSKMPQVYATADALVLPSDGRETWGLVVNESMACGIPVIVSNQVGCSGDLVREGTGLVFPCGDVEALAKSMLYLARSPMNARAIGAEARKAVSAFSAERAALGVLEALRGIGLKMSSPSDCPEPW